MSDRLCYNLVFVSFSEQLRRAVSWSDIQTAEQSLAPAGPAEKAFFPSPTDRTRALYESSHEAGTRIQSVYTYLCRYISGITVCRSDDNDECVLRPPNVSNFEERIHVSVASASGVHSYFDYKAIADLCGKRAFMVIYQ